MTQTCPMCDAPRGSLLHSSSAQGHYQEFYLCDRCDLVHVPAHHHVDLAQEEARYLEHNNHPGDPRYRAFLERLWGPVRTAVRSRSHGLDFGSGPEPVLAGMMREDGHTVSIYDPFFAPDTSVLKGTYDYIVCSETAEHFAAPATEFSRLFSLLRPGGRLGVMTGMLASWDAFPPWYYHRDLTHICFYSHRTMRWLAQVYEADVSFPSRNVALFTRR